MIFKVFLLKLTLSNGSRMRTNREGKAETTTTGSEEARDPKKREKIETRRETCYLYLSLLKKKCCRTLKYGLMDTQGFHVNML